MKNKPTYKDIERSILFNNIYLIFLIGAILNLGVIINNNSLMPVFSYSEIDNLPEGYIVFDDFNEVNYPLLSDIFGIEGIIKYSIGDFLMFTSFMAFSILGTKSLFRIIKGGLKNGFVIQNK